jgi:hypothetical protein
MFNLDEFSQIFHHPGPGGRAAQAGKLAVTTQGTTERREEQ